jgi:hypothetical protein
VEPGVRVRVERLSIVVYYTIAVIAVVVVFLWTMDEITNHEPPAELPDCEESEVLDYVVYDRDPSKRVYECVSPEEL